MDPNTTCIIDTALCDVGIATFFCVGMLSLVCVQGCACGAEVDAMLHKYDAKHTSVNDGMTCKGSVLFVRIYLTGILRMKSQARRLRNLVYR